ncbi:hypothetical protein HA402_006718 [Bradysia odoriphaga]|nr:hypothetical protein HA402_006718 [Bradysia odoriphaga]
MYKMLTNILDQIPVVTYIDPQFNFGAKFKEKYNFRLNKFSPAHSRQILYALELQGEASASHQSHLDTHAYWCPQGKFIDIPIHPEKPGDAKYLFTPSFSGCTLVVDLIEKTVNGKQEKLYRVYHVQGGKENAEYNHLSYHGYGMVTSMEYRNYGYFRPDITKLNLHIENVIGSAFMAYSDEQKKWILFHQSQYGPHGYLVVSKIFHSNHLKQITASIPEGTIVAKSNLLSVRSALGETADCGIEPQHGVAARNEIHDIVALSDFVCNIEKEISDGKIVVFFRCRRTI